MQPFPLNRAIPIKKPFGNEWRPTLVDWLFCVGVWTVSGDIAFVVSIPFTIRFFQICSMPLLAAAILRYRRDQWSLRFDIPILIWCCIDLAQGTIGNPDGVVRGIAYSCWAVNLSLLVIAVRQRYSTPGGFVWLCRTILLGVLPVCIFGLVQFSAYVVFHRNLLLTEAFGAIPRVNGWSYEPSYYSTYLIAYFVCLCEMLLRRVWVLGKRTLWILLGIVTCNLTLSTSRIGLIGLVLYAATLCIPSRFRRLALSVRVLVLSCVAAGAIYALWGTAISPENSDLVAQLAAGTGLYDTGDWTVQDRLRATFDTWDVFRQHPIWGHGLGTLPYRVAKLHGVMLSSIEDTKLFESGNVLVGVLAAGGIVNAFLFAMCIAATVKFASALLCSRSAASCRALAIAVLIGLAFMFVMVQFNQNILRNYLWLWWAVAQAGVQASLRKDMLTPNADPVRSRASSRRVLR